MLLVILNNSQTACEKCNSGGDQKVLNSTENKVKIRKKYIKAFSLLKILKTMSLISPLVFQSHAFR